MQSTKKCRMNQIKDAYENHVSGIKMFVTKNGSE